MIRLKNKRSLCLLCLIVIAAAVNSCKKDNLTNIPNLLTAGPWQLASVQVLHYIGDSQLPTDTLNTNCDTTQLFTFNKDNSCTYTNFECKMQPTATGKWSLTTDKLTLNADMLCQDTTAAGSSKPFAATQIVNLGQFSLVLQTGDVQLYYTTTQKRNIRRYGFIRQRTDIIQ